MPIDILAISLERTRRIPKTACIDWAPGSIWQNPSKIIDDGTLSQYNDNSVIRLDNDKLFFYENIDDNLMFKDTNKVYVDGTNQYTGTLENYGYPSTISTLPYVELAHTDSIQLEFDSRVLPSPLVTRTRICSLYSGRITLYAMNATYYDYLYDEPFGSRKSEFRKSKLFENYSTFNESTFTSEFNKIIFELEIVRVGSTTPTLIRVDKFDHKISPSINSSDIISTSISSHLTQSNGTPYEIAMEVKDGNTVGLVIKHGDYIAIRKETISNLNLPTSPGNIKLGGMTNGSISKTSVTLFNHTLPTSISSFQPIGVPLIPITSPIDISNDLINIKFVKADDDNLHFTSNVLNYDVYNWDNGPQKIYDDMKQYLGNTEGGDFKVNITFKEFFFHYSTINSIGTNSRLNSNLNDLMRLPRTSSDTIELSRNIQTQYIVVTLFPTYVTTGGLDQDLMPMINSVYAKAERENDIWMLNRMNSNEYVQHLKAGSNLEDIKFIRTRSSDKIVSAPPRLDGKHQLILKVTMSGNGQYTLSDNTPSFHIAKNDLYSIQNDVGFIGNIPDLNAYNITTKNGMRQINMEIEGETLLIDVTSDSDFQITKSKPRIGILNRGDLIVKGRVNVFI